MPDLRGTWVPSTEQEAEFITEFSGRAREYHEEGMDREALASGLMYLSTAVLLVDPVDEHELAGAEPSAERSDCPVCGAEFDDVRLFVGGDVIVSPCGCETHVEQFPERFGEETDE